MKNTLLQKHSHGGDFYHWQQETGINPEEILDFSVNVRPDGMPGHVKAGIFRTISKLHAYPSPHAEELKELCAELYGLKTDNFVFGNGSNELLPALCQVLKSRYPSAQILEPAFSEYRFSLEKAQIPAHSLTVALSPAITENSLCGSKDIMSERQKTASEIQAKILGVPQNSLIFIANPANPSGFLFASQELSKIIDSRQDCFFVIDEAFIEYTDEKSLIWNLPANALILRSLTKFYAVAGVRLGYLACSEELARKIQEKLPAWNVNSFASAVFQSIFRNAEETRKDAEKTKELNERRKQDLYRKLTALPYLTVYASWANYVLFSVNADCPGFWETMLTKHGISLRNCANYRGLEQGNFFRAAVRFEEDHTKLVQVIRETIEGISEPPKKKVPALMLLGTSSNAGKSILAAAFCRIFTQDGYKVRPFKAQNMSLNSGVTVKGEEMGRAQIVQAKACRTDPDCRMNPVLLKPQTDTGSQIIVLGKPHGTALARDYYRKKNELWDIVTKAYDELSQEADIMVLEGAGSPAEINLKENDIVNLKMAEYAQASVLLAGDIDRGGIYASFLGTWQTMTNRELERLTGFLVNRFRGDESLLLPAHKYLENITGKKVYGVIPYIGSIALPEEDMAGALWNTVSAEQEKTADAKTGKLNIAVILTDKISNHTDFEPLALEEECHVYPVSRPEDFRDPDLIILPGSKSVIADLEKLHQNGISQKIKEYSENVFILGICGGLQMLGEEISDPEHIESGKDSTAGLGLLPVVSTFYKEKQLTVLENIQTPLKTPCFGYEIHHGLSKETDKSKIQGYFYSGQTVFGYARNNIWGTYVHGLFDDDTFRLKFLNHVRAFRGLEQQKSCTPYDLEKSLDKLAQTVRRHVDLKAIYKSMGL